MPNELSVAIPRPLDLSLQTHLIRADAQEDLAFGLWTLSEGSERRTALLHTSILPQPDEREVHGNVSFQPAFFERACREAAGRACGVAFMHSHPFPGWQGMSSDDIRAEQKMAGAAAAITGLPLLGMTVGSDGVWSARMWEHVDKRRYNCVFCSSVRVVGDGLRSYFCEDLKPRPGFRELFLRTVTVWGPGRS